jgi:hypothetical protein
MVVMGFLGIFGLILAVLLAPAAESPALPPPPLGEGDHGSVVTYDKNGAVRWSARWTMDPVTREGRSLVQFTEQGSGRYHPFRQPVQWSLESEWIYSDRYSPLRYHMTYRSEAGEMLATESVEFDWERGVARVRRDDRSGNRDADETIEVPPDTLTPDGLATALRTLPFDDPAPVTVHLLTLEPNLYKVTFRIAGRETVSVPAGDFECYRVRMDVHLGFLRIFRVFLPDTDFWMTVEPPHFWVRYSGLESGRGSPEVVRALETLIKEPKR